MKRLKIAVLAIMVAFSMTMIPVKSEASWPVWAGHAVWHAHHMHHLIGGTAGKMSYWKMYGTATIIVGVLATMVIVFGPGWDAAKDAHTESAYQSQEMWPQQLFDQLPGGTPGRLNVVRVDVAR